MAIKITEHRKNGTKAQGEIVDELGTLNADDFAEGEYEGRKVGKRRGNGKGKYELQENGKQRRGAAVSYERVREMWPMVHVSDQELEQIDGIAAAIFKRTANKRDVYHEDETDPLRDFPTIAFRLLVDINSMHTLSSVAAYLHVTGETMNVWQKERPRFAEAIKMGKDVQEHLLASKMARGIQYPTSLIFTMKNLHSWADKIETTHHFSLLDNLDRLQSQAERVNWDKPKYAIEASASDKVIDVEVGKDVPKDVSH